MASSVNHPYIPSTDLERAKMLGAIGVESLDDLIGDIPVEHRHPRLNLAPGLSEQELATEFSAIAAENASSSNGYISFLGAGAYRHYIPSTVRSILQRGEFVIGYLARICPEKGLHLLVEALRRLTQKRGSSGPRLRLRVAGWLGPEHHGYLDRIRQQVAEWGSEGDFEYLGSIGREQKLHFLSRLDALSVPVTYRAPKGLYVLEALASGVPVVQPRVGIFPELINKTGGGLLFETGNVDDLLRSIEWLIDNRAEGRRMGQRGRHGVYQWFHSRRVAEETLAVYETL